MGMEYLWYAAEARVLARCPAFAALPRSAPAGCSCQGGTRALSEGSGTPLALPALMRCPNELTPGLGERREARSARDPLRAHTRLPELAQLAERSRRRRALGWEALDLRGRRCGLCCGRRGASKSAPQPEPRSFSRDGEGAESRWPRSRVPALTLLTVPVPNPRPHLPDPHPCPTLLLPLSPPSEFLEISAAQGLLSLLTLFLSLLEKITAVVYIPKLSPLST